ncbi:MAG: hypothetical protein IPG04_07715 [Polyangiaceae bacterium]|nr:hypothetical protein [Polyangiaceae bacterium]
MVHQHEPATVADEGPHLVREPAERRHQIDPAARRVGEQRRVDDDDIEEGAPLAELSGDVEEVPGDEARAIDLVAVQGVGVLGDVEEGLAPVGLHDLGPGAGAPDADAAGVGERVQHPLALGLGRTNVLSSRVSR